MILSIADGAEQSRELCGCMGMDSASHVVEISRHAARVRDRNFEY